ncbi:hypothetical protein KAR91_34870 [Candidatus Pacearchaeota archaeon]|nr:hypothetical protein [Candidatus Pacearchaeota archaeon]
MKALYDSKEKRTVLRLFLWFLLIAGNVHFYYAQNVAWALEAASRIETTVFVSFLDVSLFLLILVWQGWDGFDSDISIRYFFSFGLSILSYVVFYPAFYNSVHAIAKIKGIYTLSGHPVVLTGYAVLAAIAAFWTFTGMFPTEAVDVYRGREPKKRFFDGLSNVFMIWLESIVEKSKARLRKTEPEKTKVLDINQERERSFMK